MKWRRRSPLRAPAKACSRAPRIDAHPRCPQLDVASSLPPKGTGQGSRPAPLPLHLTSAGAWRGSCCRPPRSLAPCRGASLLSIRHLAGRRDSLRGCTRSKSSWHQLPRKTLGSFPPNLPACWGPSLYLWLCPCLLLQWAGLAAALQLARPLPVPFSSGLATSSSLTLKSLHHRLLWGRASSKLQWRLGSPPEA